MERVKRIIPLLFIGIVMCFFISGCVKASGSYDQRKEEAISLLKQKYDEDFNCYEIISEGEVYYASCSPVNSPDIVFETRISCGEINEDGYANRKKAKEMNDIFKNDLIGFFPSAYFRTTYENGLGTALYIYYDKQIGTLKEYEREYKYFSEEIYQYIDDGKMTEPTVFIYKVDGEALVRIEDYFSRNYVCRGDFYSTILGVDNYKMGDNQNDLGSPPNIHICFQKKAPTYVDNYNEYLRRRELLENE